MSGMLIYKPRGSTYDLFNQRISQQLAGLRAENNPDYNYGDYEHKALSPYDVYVGPPGDTSFGLSNIGVGQAVQQAGNTAATNSSGPGVPSGPPSAAGMIFPLEGGVAAHGISQGWHLPGGHPGVDLNGAMGDKILAVKDGTVKQVPNDAYGGGGNVLFINHGGGQWTTYMHLSGYTTADGIAVKQGDVVGLVGSTGYSTGPHLHFEVHEGIADTDPYPRWSTSGNVNPYPYIGLS
jgi:murein DD-endopeptidase MepM/ murein hydrolase activator NlpD